MNKKRFDIQWRLFYFQYRSFFVPVVIVVACVALFLFVVIPQIQQFLFSQGQLASDQQQLQVLQQNFKQITEFNNQQLDYDYNTVVSALPVEKDSVSMLNALSRAASVTNISLRDYNFSIGKIIPATGEPPIDVLLSVDGDLGSMQRFIHEIETSLPLAAVTTINLSSSDSASLDVVFYTKTSLEPNINANQPIQLLTKPDLNTIDKLASWENSTNTNGPNQ